MLRAQEYHTDIPLAECIAILRRTANERARGIARMWEPSPPRAIDPTVWGRRFFLFAWPDPRIRNSFAPIFYGTLCEDERGTSLRGRYAFHPVVMLFLAVFFVCACVGLVLAVVTTAAEPGTGSRPGAVNLGPILAVAGVVAVSCFIIGTGMRMGRRQREAIEEYLRSALKAELMEPSGRGTDARRLA
jgi:hypothetical protein